MHKKIYIPMLLFLLIAGTLLGISVQATDSELPTQTEEPTEPSSPLKETIVLEGKMINDELYLPVEALNRASELDIQWNQDLNAVVFSTGTEKIIVRQDYLASEPSTVQEIKNPDDLLVLVNKKHSLPADYVPPDLVDPAVPSIKSEGDPSRLLRSQAAEALEEMFAQAKEDGIELYAVSGYRSYQHQEAVFTRVAAARGEEKANLTVAYPGQSEHQTGLAMDVSSPQMNFGLSQSFGHTEEGRWIAKNAPDFGFIIRYQKDNTHITGYSYEPWHLRYVGKEAALAIAEADITLEEYLYDLEFYSKLEQ
ncbi:LAS superfamily LD-carboxypeptidase LdcB [Desulfitispora alkaliphila]|uniref:M15 family metallopeptidase n=1 Tax=Desulfitispora alkaliphila TaxID=622674 RepID=UPI003D20A228